MTAKRDLKKRVRARQQKTGESYTAARRHVVSAEAKADADASDAPTVKLTEASGAPPPEADAPATSGARPIPVDALIDLTEAATTVGLRCRVLMSETLANAIAPARVLIALRDLLLAKLRDPSTEFLRGLGLHGDVGAARATRVRDPRQRQFVERVRSGFTGTSPDGRTLGLHVDGLAIICAAWRNAPTLVVCGLEDALLRVLSGLGPPVSTQPLSSQPAFAPRLILEFAGKQYPMTKPTFVIGRHPTCDLQIKDGVISRRHVEILRRDRGWFIKDLESSSGVHYKGMQIDNKRIEDGDVFQIGPYALRFTFGT
jgi:hypothetical protein